jgi:hypothetical protein
MDVRALIVLALKASTVLTVFSSRLEAKSADLLDLLKRPGCCSGLSGRWRWSCLASVPYLLARRRVAAKPVGQSA